MALSFGSQYNEIGRKIGENLIKNYGFSSPMIQFGVGLQVSQIYHLFGLVMVQLTEHLKQTSIQKTLMKKRV